MTRTITILFLIISLISCKVSKPSSPDKSAKTDNKPFKLVWDDFARAIAEKDLLKIKELSSDCIYCTDCVTNTPREDSLFNKYRDKNENIWYDKLYKEMSYIPTEQFIEQDYNLIFTEDIRLRFIDKSKVYFNDDLGKSRLKDLRICFKEQLYNNHPQIHEVLITVIDPSKESEGLQLALNFIETKKGYKFYAYYTIP